MRVNERGKMKQSSASCTCGEIMLCSLFLKTSGTMYLYLADVACVLVGVALGIVEVETMEIVAAHRDSSSKSGLGVVQLTYLHPE